MCSCENTSVFFDKVSNSQGQIGTFKQKNNDQNVSFLILVKDLKNPEESVSTLMRGK